MLALAETFVKSAVRHARLELSWTVLAVLEEGSCSLWLGACDSQRCFDGVEGGGGVLCLRRCDGERAERGQ